MGIDLDISYTYGFTWNIPNNINDDVAEKIINLLYELYDKKFYYITAQYDKYYKSRKIMIGLEDPRLATKILCTYINKREIKELFNEDEYLRNSPFLNYFYNYVQNDVEDPSDGFSKQDFYDNRCELTQKSWEINERNDIILEPKRGKHYLMIQKIYNFLSDIDDISIKNNGNDIDIDKIWEKNDIPFAECNATFKWHNVIYMSY